VLGVADALRPEARAVVRALSGRLGLEVWMISGDNRTTALSLAQDAGIAEQRVVAEALPADKAAKVKALCDRGRGGVAFVGDGINDAPALARASVGVALGAGSKIAVAAAKIVLVKSDLWDVVCALDLSKVVFRRIQLNFLWALGYNVLGLPIAAGVLFPLQRMQAAPEVAGLAMALSSVSVVASSLLLNYYQRPRFVDGGEGGEAGGGGRAAAAEDEGETVALQAVAPKGEAEAAAPPSSVAVVDLSATWLCACSCAECTCNDEESCCSDGGSGSCCGCSSCRCGGRE
jgi:soluble P-type ATPase